MGKMSTLIRVVVVALGIFFGQKIIAPIVAVVFAIYFGIPGLDTSEAFTWMVSIVVAICLYLFTEVALFRVRREGFTA